MMQSISEVQVNVCRPSYFYNISQQHNFLVYDFRPTLCRLNQISIDRQKLKNTFKIDSVIHLQQLNTIQSATDIQLYQVTPNHDQERVRITNLFKQRKRIFNFFLPFNASDSFCIYLSDYLYSLDEAKNEQYHDYFTISLDLLDNICQMFNKETLHKVSLMKQLEKKSPNLISNTATYISFLNKQYSIETPEDLNVGFQYVDLQKSSKFDKHHSSSAPNLVAYDILDQAISNIEVFQSVLNVMRVFKQEKIREINLIFEPATIMFDQYPSLDYCLHKNQKFLNKDLPNEIVEGKLYLGNASHAMNQELLVNSLKITHIVNAAKEIKNGLNGVQYLNIPIYDEETEKIFVHFGVVYQFIDKLWDNEKSRILVHCAQGRSRSATLVIMFLMRKFMWDLETAYNYVQERREVVRVNDGFLKQLEKYETLLRREMK